MESNTVYHPFIKSITKLPMKVNKLRLALLFVVIAVAVIAESIPTGSVTGTIKDAVTKTSMKDVKVHLSKNGKVVSSATTNASGKFDFKSIGIGIYSLEAIKQAYDTFRIVELHINE